MQHNTENVSNILGLREKSPESPRQQKELSRLALTSCVLGVIAPFLLAVSLFLPGPFSENRLFLPFFVSASALVLSVSAMFRVAFAHNRKKGIVLALIGLVLGGGTLAVVVFIFLAAVAMENCPFLG